MANSLNFLNKPAPAKQQPIGPQPKPSTAAPKAFLDKSNPWAVGGGTPTASVIDRQARERQAAAQTAARPAPVASSARAPVQAVPRSTPEPRQAAPARAPARPAPQPAPTPIQMVAARPTPAPQPAPWQMAPSPEQAMAMRPMGQPAPWQMAPTAEQGMAMRPQQAPAPAPARPFQPQPLSPSGSSYGYTNAPQQPAPAPTAPATPPTAPAAAQPQARGPFYGYAPPGPLTAPRPFTAQRNQLMPYMSDRPNFSNLGQRALMTDEALAVEDARRQRDQAGGFGALQRSGTFRPWNSYSPAEKYLRRYGVMPPGEQIAPPTSGAEAMAENRAQTERLTAEYRARYGRYPKWDNYDYRQAPAPAPAAAPPATSTAAASTAWAAPVDPAQAAHYEKNNQVALQINPQAATIGLSDEDANAVAREIVKRYLPDKDVSTLTLAEIGAILALSYTPPPGLETQYGYDVGWLSELVAAE